MKALTVREPWASAIVDGFKPVENRSAGFPKRFRGTLLIHTAKEWSERGRSDTRVRDAYAAGQRHHALKHVPAYHGIPPHPFQGGLIIGRVEVVDIHPDAGCCRPWGESTYYDGTRDRTEVTHLVLEHAERHAHPTPARGALGLWTVPDDYLDAYGLR